MAKLSSRARKALPKSSFGEPGKRAYPMPDKSRFREARPIGRLCEAVSEAAEVFAIALKVQP